MAGAQAGLFVRPVVAPLAERLRPQTLEAVVGQEGVAGKDGVLTQLIAAGTPHSVIFWGPPGTGKTTLARLYAQAFGAHFVQLSAVLAGVADIRTTVAEAERNAETGMRTVLFVDEIHRFNKAQQDAFLPHVESGLITLVGATTENPSFALNNALLSRTQVLVLHALDDVALAEILDKAEAETGALPLTGDGRAHLVHLAQGDARSLLGMVQVLASVKPAHPLNPEELVKLVGKRAALYDRDGDQHYNLISALHKTVRGSDPDAALYYLARMLQGGEDGMYIARRLVRMAVEDIGLADPDALPLSMAAQAAYHALGSPEGDLALAEMTVYLALAPKSNRTYVAFKAAQAHAAHTGQVPPPNTILNAPTTLMKQQGYGADYQYDPDTPHGFSGQNYWPDGHKPKAAFYSVPKPRGFERELAKRLEYFDKLRHTLE